MVVLIGGDMAEEEYQIVEVMDLIEITCDACDHKALFEPGTKLNTQDGIYVHTCEKCGQSTLIAIGAHPS